MAITVRNPNRVFLGGEPAHPTFENQFAAKEAITPGMLLDLDSTATVNRWKKAATAKSPTTSVALDSLMLNQTCSSTPATDTQYAISDLVETAQLSQGHKWWAIVASGAAITFGQKLENAGDGKLRAWTDASQAFRALEAVTATADARIRVEVL